MSCMHGVAGDLKMVCHRSWNQGLLPSNLERFYVLPPEGPLRVFPTSVVNQIEHWEPGEANAMLCYTRRGMGTSTALTRLETLSKGKQLPVRFSMFEKLDPASLHIGGFLLTVLERLLDEIEVWANPEEVVDTNHLKAWLNRQEVRALYAYHIASDPDLCTEWREASERIRALQKACKEIPSLYASLEKWIEPRLHLLVDLVWHSVRCLTRLLERNGLKGPVLLIDDGDKIQRAQLEALFWQYGTILSDLPCPVLYVVPDAFARGQGWMPIRDMFAWEFNCFGHSGRGDGTFVADKLKPGKQESAFLIRIVEQRMEMDLWEDHHLLRQVVEACEGNPRDLLWVIRTAALSVRAEEEKKLNKAAIEEALATFRGRKRWIDQAWA